MICLVLLAAGCRGTDEVCLPRQTRECFCPGGSRSSAVCEEDGLGWGECRCPGEDAATDSEVPDDTTDATVEDECVLDSDCDDSDPCTEDRCDPDFRTCLHEPVDGDGDGFIAARVGSVDCGGDDCDDTRDDVYPGAGEDSCFDGVDQNCDGIVGPGLMGEHVLMDQPDPPWFDMVWTGSEVGFIWRTGITPQGQLIHFDPAEPTVTEPLEVGHPEVAPMALAWMDTGWAVAHMASDEMYVELLDADGMYVGSVIELGPSWSQPPDVVWTGSQIGILWTAPASPDPVIMFTRLADDGTVLGTDATVGDGRIAGIVWTGSQWITAREASSSFSLQRWSADGTAVGEEIRAPHAGPTLTEPGAVAWTGSVIGAVWVHDDSGAPVFMRVEPDGTPIDDPAMVLEGAGGQAAGPKVHWTGSAHALTWTAVDASTSSLWHAQISPDGSLVFPPTALVTDGVASDRGPALVWTGSELSVAWAAYSPAQSLYYNRIGWCD